MKLDLQFLFITKYLTSTEFLILSTESFSPSTEVFTSKIYVLYYMSLCLDIGKFVCRVKIHLRVYIDCIFLNMIKHIN